MPTLSTSYGTSTAITITMASLAAAAARESAAVNNASDGYLDALVQVKVKLAAGTPAADKAVIVYVYGSEDGATYTDNATGSDAAITLVDPTNMFEACRIQAPSSGAATWESQPFAVARAFRGILPRKWGIVVKNDTNVALDSSGSSATYTGIKLVSA